MDTLTAFALVSLAERIADARNAEEEFIPSPCSLDSLQLPADPEARAFLESARLLVSDSLPEAEESARLYQLWRSCARLIARDAPETLDENPAAEGTLPGLRFFAEVQAGEAWDICELGSPSDLARLTELSPGPFYA